MSEVRTQLLTDDASGALVERRYRLRVAAGPDQGKDHALEDGTTLVGTHPDNDLVLTDATVSRHHLEIRVRRDGIEVRDLDTTNGTRHGGARVGQVILVGPARLRLGRHTELDVEPVDAGVELDDWPGDRFGDVLGTAALADLGDPAAPPRPATAPGDPGAPLDGGAGRPPTSPPGAPTATSGDVLDLPFKEAKAALVEGFERDYLTALLARHRGNISRAASEAGIDRNYVHRLVKKYGLEVDRG